VPNLKFVSLLILELLVFNAQNFKGSRGAGYALFYPLLTFLGLAAFTWTGRRITLNDETDEQDTDDTNQLTSDVNS